MARTKRYIGRHIEDCTAVAAVEQGLWAHPWGVSSIVYASRSGAIGMGSSRWIEWNCNNNFGCRASVMVREDAIIAAVDA